MGGGGAPLRRLRRHGRLAVLVTAQALKAGDTNTNINVNMNNRDHRMWRLLSAWTGVAWSGGEEYGAQTEQSDAAATEATATATADGDGDGNSEGNSEGSSDGPPPPPPPLAEHAEIAAALEEVRAAAAESNQQLALAAKTLRWGGAG